MKCTITPMCEHIRNLVLDIDLRVEPDVRIEKIAQDIIPLNDKIGEHHISLNLAYKSGEQTCHVNLPAFVSENGQERILCALFPDDTYAIIRNNGQEEEINLLEYHIDRLTETVSEKCGIADTNNRVIYGFPIEGGTEDGTQASVDNQLYQPLSKLLQAIAKGIPAVVVSTDGQYVSYDLTQSADKQTWSGIIGKTYFTRDADKNVVYNYQYYELPSGFKGLMGDSYTRYWKTKTLAGKDDVLREVNLSLRKTVATNTIDNTAGTGVTLEAATNAEAGLMTSTDRQKMTQLFDGTMLDSANPTGYHRHNYLEMSDLPPTVEIAVTSYQEFKNAVKKLQAEVAKGKYGKILVTGICRIDDDTEFDLRNIDIECLSFFYVNDKPLRVRNANVKNLNFDTGNNSSLKAYEALRVSCNLWNGSTFGTLHIARCAYDDSTPQITILGDGKPGNIYFNVDKISGYSHYRNKHIPIVIQCTETAQNTVLKINSVERMGTDNDINSVKLVSSDFDNVHLALSKDVLVENIDQLKNLSPIAGELFDMRSREVSVPTPALNQRDQHFVLCADGVWRDIRTLINS